MRPATREGSSPLHGVVSVDDYLSLPPDATPTLDRERTPLAPDRESPSESVTPVESFECEVSPGSSEEERRGETAALDKADGHRDGASLAQELHQDRNASLPARCHAWDCLGDDFPSAGGLVGGGDSILRSKIASVPSPCRRRGALPVGSHPGGEPAPVVVAGATVLSGGSAASSSCDGGITLPPPPPALPLRPDGTAASAPAATGTAVGQLGTSCSATALPTPNLSLIGAESSISYGSDTPRSPVMETESQWAQSARCPRVVVPRLDLSRVRRDGTPSAVGDIAIISDQGSFATGSAIPGLAGSSGPHHPQVVPRPAWRPCCFVSIRPADISPLHTHEPKSHQLPPSLWSGGQYSPGTLACPKFESVAAPPSSGRPGVAQYRPNTLTGRPWAAVSSADVEPLSFGSGPQEAATEVGVGMHHRSRSPRHLSAEELDRSPPRNACARRNQRGVGDTSPYRASTPVGTHATTEAPRPRPFTSPMPQHLIAPTHNGENDPEVGEFGGRRRCHPGVAANTSDTDDTTTAEARPLSPRPTPVPPLFQLRGRSTATDGGGDGGEAVAERSGYEGEEEAEVQGRDEPVGSRRVDSVAPPLPPPRSPPPRPTSLAYQSSVPPVAASASDGRLDIDGRSALPAALPGTSAAAVPLPVPAMAGTPLPAQQFGRGVEATPPYHTPADEEADNEFGSCVVGESSTARWPATHAGEDRPPPGAPSRRAGDARRSTGARASCSGAGSLPSALSEGPLSAGRMLPAAPLSWTTGRSTMLPKSAEAGSSAIAPGFPLPGRDMGSAVPPFELDGAGLLPGGDDALRAIAADLAPPPVGGGGGLRSEGRMPVPRDLSLRSEGCLPEQPRPRFTTDSEGGRLPPPPPSAEVGSGPPPEAPPPDPHAASLFGSSGLLPPPPSMAADIHGSGGGGGSLHLEGAPYSSSFGGSGCAAEVPLQSEGPMPLPPRPVHKAVAAAGFDSGAAGGVPVQTRLLPSPPRATGIGNDGRGAGGGLCAGLLPPPPGVLPPQGDLHPGRGLLLGPGLPQRGVSGAGGRSEGPMRPPSGLDMSTDTAWGIRGAATAPPDGPSSLLLGPTPGGAPAVMAAGGGPHYQHVYGSYPGMPSGGSCRPSGHSEGPMPPPPNRFARFPCAAPPWGSHGWGLVSGVPPPPAFSAGGLPAGVDPYRGQRYSHPATGAGPLPPKVYSDGMHSSGDPLAGMCGGPPPASGRRAPPQAPPGLSATVPAVPASCGFAPAPTPHQGHTCPMSLGVPGVAEEDDGVAGAPVHARHPSEGDAWSLGAPTVSLGAPGEAEEDDGVARVPVHPWHQVEGGAGSPGAPTAAGHRGAPSPHAATVHAPSSVRAGSSPPLGAPTLPSAVEEEEQEEEGEVEVGGAGVVPMPCPSHEDFGAGPNGQSEDDGPPAMVEQGQQTTPQNEALVARQVGPRKRSAVEALRAPREGKFSLVEIDIDKWQSGTPSVRRRVRVLDHWRNERLIYKRDPILATPTVAAVVVAKEVLTPDRALPERSSLGSEDLIRRSKSSATPEKLTQQRVRGRPVNRTRAGPAGGLPRVRAPKAPRARPAAKRHVATVAGGRDRGPRRQQVGPKRQSASPGPPLRPAASKDSAGEDGDQFQALPIVDGSSGPCALRMGSTNTGDPLWTSCDILVPPNSFSVTELLGGKTLLVSVLSDAGGALTIDVSGRRTALGMADHLVVHPGDTFHLTNDSDTLDAVVKLVIVPLPGLLEGGC